MLDEFEFFCCCYRWNKIGDWESNTVEFDWKEIVEFIMRFYIEVMDGFSIEIKESVLVWYY